MTQILSAEQLLLDINAWIEIAKDTQLERSTAIAMNADMPKEEKQAKMQAIWSEKYDANAVLNSLKMVVTFEGNQYEMPRKQTATRTGSTSTKPGRFAIGDIVHYTQDSTTSEEYEVTESGLKNSAGEIIAPSKATLLHKLSLMGKTEEQFRADYLAENGREFKGYPGLSDAHWSKVLPQV